MADLSLTCAGSANVTVKFEGLAPLNILRRTLIRTGGPLEADTIIDIIDPGTGWVVEGDDITFSTATDFVEQTQVFRGGQMQLTAEGAGDDNDIYFVSASGNLAFETVIQTNDVIQFWKFVAELCP